MLPNNRDIYATAKILIDRYGQEADQHAEERLSALIASNDAKGAGIWLSVRSAISVLKTDKSKMLH